MKPAPAGCRHFIPVSTPNMVMLIFIVSMCVCRNVGSMILVFLSTAIAESCIAGICVISISFSFQDTQAV